MFMNAPKKHLFRKQVTGGRFNKTKTWIISKHLQTKNYERNDINDAMITKIPVPVMSSECVCKSLNKNPVLKTVTSP